mgnify:CR=1 FL=1
MTNVSCNIHKLADEKLFYRMHAEAEKYTNSKEREYNNSTALIKNIDEYFLDVELSVLNAYSVYLKSLDNIEDAKLFEISDIPEYPRISNRKCLLVIRKTDKKFFHFYIKDREGMYEIVERKDNCDKHTSVKVGKTPYPNLEFFLTNTDYAFTMNTWSQSSIERRN